MNKLNIKKELMIEPSYKSIKEAMDNFWNMAKAMRKDLGKNGYYLDEYLSIIFKTLANLDLTTAIPMVDSICWNVVKDCHIVCENQKNREKSGFYSFVKKYIDTHPIKYSDEETKVEFYASQILTDNLELFIQKFISDFNKKILYEIDYPISNEMYKKISNLLGEQRMKKLNDLMYEAFTFCPLIVAMAQQIVSRCIGMFLYRNPETSKNIYRLMIENKI